MNFNTISYFIFLPCAIFLYFICPRKLRNGALLIISYFIYMNWDAKFALLLLTSTVTTYVFARLIEKGRRKQLWLILNIVINLSILVFFKYFNFFSTLTASTLSFIGLETDPFLLNVMLPVGISFYTFQALGYTIDVYRGDEKAERNFIDFALFVSFFPQLVAGPIARASSLLPQLKVTRRFEIQRVFEGALLILWGLFKKMVIADNLAVIVNFVFGSPAEEVTGIQSLVAAAAFTVELYCDFSAYTDIARGSAHAFGFRLMQNFDAPLFATSIKDFWRRWHISLSSWFRDYLYIPLGGNRHGKARTCMNVMIVFVISGIWHGAAMTFVIWGLLHGLYQVISILTQPCRRKIMKAVGISPENRALTVIKTLFTFALVSLAFVFFRADTAAQAVNILKKIFLLPVEGLAGAGLSALPLGYLQLAVYFVLVIIGMGADRLIHTRRLRLAALARNPFRRYACYFLILCAIIVFGYYGSGFNPQQFIYFKF